MNKLSFVTVICCIALLAPFSILSGSEEFIVNTYDDHPQNDTSVAMNKNGVFVVTWTSRFQDGNEYGVFAQMFDSSFKKSKSKDIKVNRYTKGNQNLSDIAISEEGSFVITWVSAAGQDKSGRGVFAQRFNKKGRKMRWEFQVNSYSTGDQTNPTIAMNNYGFFVITWMSEDNDSDDWGIFAQLFDPKGKVVGDEFQVNTHTKDEQVRPDVAINDSGDYIITWSSKEQDGSGWGVYAQQFSCGTGKFGEEIHVNSYTDRDQKNPAAALSEKGNFVITWHSYDQDGDDYGIFAQRFDADGKKNGGEFQVNTHTEYEQEYPKIAINDKGNFTIVWQSFKQDGHNSGVFAQKFNADGTKVGSEFQVNTHTKLQQHFPDIAMKDSGDFVITWTSYNQLRSGSKSSSDDIYARAYKSSE